MVFMSVSSEVDSDVLDVLTDPEATSEVVLNVF
jgi:hypothetical protein